MTLRFQVDDETELRFPEEADAGEIYDLITRDLQHMKEWLPWVHDDYNIEQTREFVRRNLESFRENRSFSMRVLYRGRAAGNIGFNYFDWEHRKTEIGYWLGSSFQGRGLITKSCRVLVNYAFRTLSLNRVSILCGVGNLKSRAIPERLGFKMEGVLREAEWVHTRFIDLAVYSMLAREWQARGR